MLYIEGGREKDGQRERGRRKGKGKANLIGNIRGGWWYRAVLACRHHRKVNDVTEGSYLGTGWLGAARLGII